MKKITAIFLCIVFCMSFSLAAEVQIENMETPFINDMGITISQYMENNASRAAFSMSILFDYLDSSERPVYESFEYAVDTNPSYVGRNGSELLLFVFSEEEKEGVFIIYDSQAKNGYYTSPMVFESKDIAIDFLSELCPDGYFLNDVAEFSQIVGSFNKLEIRFSDIPWYSSKADVFQSMRINDLMTEDLYYFPEGPTYILGRMEGFFLGEYNNEREYQHPIYCTVPYGDINLHYNGHMIDNMYLLFLPEVVNGSINEDEERAKFVEAQLYFSANDLSAEYDALVNEFSQLYGQPDRSEEFSSQDDLRHAYSIWYGGQDTYLQIVINDLRSVLIVEFAKANIDELLP